MFRRQGKERKGEWEYKVMIRVALQEVGGEASNMILEGKENRTV